MLEKRGGVGEQFINGGYVGHGGSGWGCWEGWRSEMGLGLGPWGAEREDQNAEGWQGGAAEGCHIPRREEQLVQGNVWLNSKDVPKPVCEWLQVGEFWSKTKAWPDAQMEKVLDFLGNRSNSWDLACRRVFEWLAGWAWRHCVPERSRAL